MGQRLGLTDLLDPLLNQLGTPTIMAGVELLELRGPGLLHGLKRGPALEEITGLQAVQLQPSPTLGGSRVSADCSTGG